MKANRLFAAALAFATTLGTIPLSASAAATAEVIEFDGVPTAFVSSFGKISYEGSSYKTYKTFDEAVKALGKDGGNIVFTGTLNLGEYKDTAGRGKITVIGIGTKSQGNLVDFSGTEEAPVKEVELGGDLYMDFVNLRLDAGAYLLTSGYEFNTYNEFDTYHTERYVKDAANIIEYPNPPSIALGTADGRSGSVVLDGGIYTTVAAGTIDGHTAKDTVATMTVDDITADTLVAGSVGGTLTGDTKLTVNDGEFDTLVAGSVGGTINGNVYLTVNGGTFENTVFGAENGATINGSVVMALNGGTFSNAITLGNGKVSGKKIVITDTKTAVNMAQGAADYIVRTTDALCQPQFDGDKLTGFLISDVYGIPVESVVINGTKQTGEAGIYQLNAGESTVTVADVMKVEINRNAHYVAGYSDGRFAPQNNMTKAEAVTLLVRLMVDEDRIKGKVTSDFRDVASGSWYEPYIGMFQRMDFLDKISSNGGTTFEPDAKITRGEFTQLLYEIAGMTGGTTAMKLRSFSDVKKVNPYRDAIYYAVSNNIVLGYDDGTFKPDNNITRAEVVTMVNRFLGRDPNGAGELTFNDVEGHWAKNQILAACGDENVSWTASTGEAEYVLTGNGYKDYMIALYDQSQSLSADAIRRGVDTIAEQMKKDVLGTPNTADLYGDRMTGKTYYISEKNGNDENDGLSPETAVKTIAGLNAKVRFPKKGTSYLFERGGTYRGQITASAAGLTIGCYGDTTQPKPLLMQSRRNYADPDLWEETAWENVWKYKGTLNNVGVIGFDHDLFDYSADSYNELYGKIMNTDVLGFKGVQDMDEDLQFYSVLSNDKTETPEGVNVKQNELYLYSVGGNPGSRFQSIEIGENSAIIAGNGDDVVIDNLAFKFTGGHGMGGAGGSKDRVVTNCVFSWLGGSVLSIDFRGSGSPVNYGNAVEIYGSCDGYRVENCWMYQIYDTAVTHQYSDETACTMEGVRYYGLLMEYCHWGIEFYNAPAKSTSVPKYVKDVHIAYNICRTGGMGWGSIVRERKGMLYCGSSLDSRNSDELTEYNVFDRCYGYLLTLPASSKEVDDKNIYIQFKGEMLGNLKGTYLTCDYDAADNIAKYWGDKNAITIVLDEEPVLGVFN